MKKTAQPTTAPLPSDPRHIKRVLRMQKTFSQTFRGKQPSTEIDEIIHRFAPEWPIHQMSKINLAILRSAVLELVEGKTPFAVVINEAVEIAKMYGTENSPKLINGVLSSVAKHLNKNKDKDTKDA